MSSLSTATLLVSCVSCVCSNVDDTTVLYVHLCQILISPADYFCSELCDSCSIILLQTTGVYWLEHAASSFWTPDIPVPWFPVGGWAAIPKESLARNSVTGNMDDT